LKDLLVLVHVTLTLLYEGSLRISYVQGQTNMFVLKQQHNHQFKLIATLKRKTLKAKNV
jgi:hypothetical protein